MCVWVFPLSFVTAWHLTSVWQLNLWQQQHDEFLHNMLETDSVSQNGRGKKTWNDQMVHKDKHNSSGFITIANTSMNDSWQALIGSGARQAWLISQSTDVNTVLLQIIGRSCWSFPSGGKLTHKNNNKMRKLCFCWFRKQSQSVYSLLRLKLGCW